jgi:HNH endonuclease/AP2 domain
MWLDTEQFDAVKRELARPTFRRSALCNARRRYLRLRRKSVKRGVLFQPFHEWVQQAGVRRSDGRLTQEVVHELLDYRPETGALTWEQRDRRWFEDEPYWKRSNTRFAGQPAGLLHKSTGHREINLFDQCYQEHRIIWLWMEGRWPVDEIHHENHVRDDNRWANLFEATSQQNVHNQSLRKTNTSGRTGVYWRDNYGKFVAEIGARGRQLHLGHFDTFEEACAAREVAERKLGYHINHEKV